MSLKPEKKVRDIDIQKENNLCVVIYSHNNAKTIENLIKQLKTQSYPRRNYSLNVILDNCTDESEFLFQSDLDELAEGRIKDGGQFYKRMRIYMNYNTQE